MVNYDSIPGLVTRDINLTVGSQTFPVRVLTPGKLADEPMLLLTFGLGIHWGLYEEPYDTICRRFLENGHRVATWDIPAHGDRIDAHGEGITGFRNAFFAGKDPFVQFVSEAKAVLDLLLKEKLATEGRIAVCGISRTAYMTLRWLAEDKRVNAITAIGPVTDWRALSEFSADVNRPEMNQLDIARFVDGMAGTPIYMVIGNDDERVSSTACARFFINLVEANERLGKQGKKVRFEMFSTPGHQSGVEWFETAASFLQDTLASADRSSQ